MTELVAAGTDVPRLGDLDAGGEERVGGDLGKDGGVRVEAGCAREDRREVEAEAIDTGLRVVAQRVQDQRANLRPAAIERIAGAGVVDERAVGGVRIIQRFAEAAQRNRRAEAIAFAGVVEHQVEDDADAGSAKRGDRLPQFGNAAGCQARVDRHRYDGVVTPAVGEAERRQVTLVDPGDDRHQLDRGDLQRLEVGDDRGMGEGCDRATLLLRNVRMQHGEAADIDLVDQAAGGEEGRRGALPGVIARSFIGWGRD